jgi:hypothetical protein
MYQIYCLLFCQVAEKLTKKNALLEKETKKRDRIEETVKEKKKEQGRVTRELTKIEQQIKESVGILLMTLTNFVINECLILLS